MRKRPTTFEVDGDAIREERMRTGLEVSELAEKAGISRRFLSHLETGSRTRMRPRRYAALRSALNVQDDDTRLLAPTEEHPHQRGSDHGTPEGDPRRP